MSASSSDLGVSPFLSLRPAFLFYQLHMHDRLALYFSTALFTVGSKKVPPRGGSEIRHPQAPAGSLENGD